jgi:hypothetical protein
MTIYLKSILYSILFFGIVGTLSIGLLWLFTDGAITDRHILFVLIVTVVFSPRFEVVTLQSGKVLQMKGLLLLMYHSYKNRKR